MTRRRRRRLSRSTLALGLLGLAGLGFVAFADPTPRLVWNGSASAPIGLYRLSLSKPSRGDLVLARLPVWARQLAAERRYLPGGVPLVKRIAALDGDDVCAAGMLVTVNGQIIAERLDHDSLGRPLPRWTGCRRLGQDDVFLLMEGEAGSFDGRYFGPLSAAAVIGRLAPLWTNELSHSRTGPTRKPAS